MVGRKFKKLLAMTLTLGLAASIMSVSAAEDPPGFVAQNERTEEQYSTLQAAVKAAESGDTIKLLCDIDETGVMITPPKGPNHLELTIDLGGYSIDGKGEGRGLVAAEASQGSSVDLTVKNGTLKNCDAGTNSGGAISCTGGLTLENCVFENNAARAGAGVNVLPRDSAVEIRNCVFKNNTATGASNSGGGVFIGANGDAVIENTTFENNSAKSMGGAVYADHGTVTVNGSVFSGNTASYGGAVSGAEAALIVKASEFTGNSASTMGGAVHIQNVVDDPGSLQIVGGSMTDNEAGYGGAVSAAGSSVSVTGTEITGNKALTNGGAVYAQGEAALEINASLSANTAGYDGGAVYANKARVTIAGDLTGNTAGRDGGAVCAYQYTLRIDGDLTGNTASGNGGAVFSKWSEIAVTGSVTGNSAAFGGGVYSGENTDGEEFDGAADLTKASVYNNTASAAGDDIYLGSGNSAEMTAVGESWSLAGCGDPIDGWYQDGEGVRWNGDGDPGNAEEFVLELQDGTATVFGKAALKAAHAVVEEIPDEETPSGAPDPDGGNSGTGSADSGTGSDSGSSADPTEEIPEEDTPLAPPTGEGSGPSASAALVILSGAGLAVLAAARRRMHARG